MRADAGSPDGRLLETWGLTKLSGGLTALEGLGRVVAHGELLGLMEQAH